MQQQIQQGMPGGGTSAAVIGGDGVNNEGGMIGEKKKSKLWLWIIIAVIVLIIVGVGVWLLLRTGSDGGLLGGGSVPSPPPLPE